MNTVSLYRLYGPREGLTPGRPHFLAASDESTADGLIKPGEAMARGRSSPRVTHSAGSYICIKKSDSWLSNFPHRAHSPFISSFTFFWYRISFGGNLEQNVPIPGSKNGDRGGAGYVRESLLSQVATVE